MSNCVCRICTFSPLILRYLHHATPSACDLVATRNYITCLLRMHPSPCSSMPTSTLVPEPVIAPDQSAYGDLLDTYGNKFEIPDFSIKQIRDAIPAHCFERSALTGYAYICRDILLLTCTFYLSYTCITPSIIPSPSIRFVLWAIYGFLQGLFATGLWVIAHECGHQSFSPSRIVNDITGWFLHSALLVPYFSWKISHGKHHKATGHMERDMVFVPKTRQHYANRLQRQVHELSELTEEAPIMTALVLVARQLVGWPMYLLYNRTGHDYHERQAEGRGKGKRNGFTGGVNHFDPSSPLYDARDAKYIALSDLGLGIMAIILSAIAQKYSWSNVFIWYGVPYIWVNHWLGIVTTPTKPTSSFMTFLYRLLMPPIVAITYLQHTDPTLPHYGPESWTFVRGAASTIDREFGFIGRSLFHGIIETHVLHHYVSTIPFYHADEASEAIKPVMGQYYRSDTAGGAVGFLRSLWTSARWCQWVEVSEGAKGVGKDVLFYRNRNGLGTRPMKVEGKME